MFRLLAQSLQSSALSELSAQQQQQHCVSKPDFPRSDFLGSSSSVSKPQHRPQKYKYGQVHMAILRADRPSLIFRADFEDSLLLLESDEEFFERFFCAFERFELFDSVFRDFFHRLILVRSIRKFLDSSSPSWFRDKSRTPRTKL